MRSLGETLESFDYSPIFRVSGCWRKNAHITPVASIPRLIGPHSHPGSLPPPGQSWPPP